MYIHCSVYFNSTHISIDINTHVFINVYWYITFHSLKSDMHTCSQYSASLIVSNNLISPYFYLPIHTTFLFYSYLPAYIARHSWAGRRGVLAIAVWYTCNPLTATSFTPHSLKTHSLALTQSQHTQSLTPTLTH